MSTRRGAMLIELIVVVVIIAVVITVYYGLGKKSGKDGAKSTPAQAMDKAHGVECSSNLSQLRASIQMDSADKGQFPAALNPKSGLSLCPVSGQLYKYDPQTGEVHCTTPGHEKF